MPEWKRKKDPFIAQVFHRPISFVFSSLFCELGLTPNQVSFISLIIAIVTCLCFAMENKNWYIVGAIMMNLWSVTDSADGNMARSIGSKPYGDFIDATSSYVMVGFIFPVLGVAVYRYGGMFIPEKCIWIVIAGAYASSSDTMARLFFQKMKSNAAEIRLGEMRRGELSLEEYIKSEDVYESKAMKFFVRIDAELSMGGWNLVAIILCVIFNCLDIYILFYVLYYPAVFVVMAFYLIKKTECLKK